MKPVLIIQNSNNSLKLNENAQKIKSDYILSGVFTEFDVINRNERIYTADEYVPHVDRMMEKKQWGVIYGEYDHPDVFDVSMKFVSHTVENAFYNKEHNRIDGEIRLLNTHYGKDAKALVDDGLPLFVSSRAAGITESTGKVKLKQLFTYDIVADPGFASAKMQVKTMNESLGFGNDTSLMLVESTKHQLSQLATKYEKSSDIHVFDLSDESKTNDLFNMNKNDLVTKKQISDWSKYLTSQIKENNAKILAKITESKGTSKGDERIEDLINYQEELEMQFEKVIGYLDYLAEKVQYSINTTEVLEKKTDDVVKYTNYLAENLDNAISYTNYLAEQLDNSIDYSNYLAEGLDKAIDYSNYLAESLDKAIDYSEYIAENLTNTIKYSNYLAENLDKAIDYTEYIAENLDANIGYSTYLAENLDVNIGYVQYVAENLDSTINYADYLSECVDTAMNYSNTIAESINKSATEGTLITEKLATADEFLIIESASKKAKEEEEEEEACDTDMTKEEEEKVEGKKKVKDLKAKKSVKEEEETIINTSENTTTATEEIEVEKVENSDEIHTTTKTFVTDSTNESLSDKINKLIEEAKKREASKEVKPNFYEFLTADDLTTFESLSNEEQENIKVAVNESTGYYSRHDVLSIMKQVLEKSKPTAEQSLIDGMPTEIQPLWEKVDAKMKQSIIAQSKFYDTSTTTLVEHFWMTRNLEFVNEKKVLLESNNPFEKMNKLSDDEVDYFTNKFKGL
jgi:hypothetical protein